MMQINLQKKKTVFSYRQDDMQHIVAFKKKCYAKLRINRKQAGYS